MAISTEGLIHNYSSDTSKLHFSFANRRALSPLYAYNILGIQDKKEKQKFSLLRQSLALLSSEIREIIRPFFSDKPVFHKGGITFKEGLEC